jgi:hypothetical protein
MTFESDEKQIANAKYVARCSTPAHKQRAAAQKAEKEKTKTVSSIVYSLYNY